MNLLSRILPCAAIAMMMSLQIFCQSCSRNRSEVFWDTGNTELDAALRRIDTLESVADYNLEITCEAFRRIASIADATESPRVRAASFFAKGALAELEELPDGESTAIAYDSMAIAELRREGDDSYIMKRMEFELTRHNRDITSRTGELYSLLQYFTSINDSILVVDVLFELSGSFGEVWNPDIQKDCFMEIIHWTPQFISPQRDIMRYNILALERGSAPEKTYIHTLDSLASAHKLLEESLPMGVMVFSDRYRLRGNPADLDTAAVYADKMPSYHDALKVYWTQRLYHAIKIDDRTTASRFASLIQEHAADSSLMEIETLPALAEYYRSIGDITGCSETRRYYSMLRAMADAHEESSSLSVMETDRKVSEITRRASIASRKWITVTAATLLILAIVTAWLCITIRHRKKDTKKLDILHHKLDKSRRRLVVAELKESDLNNENPGTPMAHNWERFEAVFAEMHPGFAENLRKDFPNLTRNDIRLCAFISMDMDTKHIAGMLSIQPDSVKKQMRRLRTKLGLDPGTPLLDFLKRY